MRPWMDGFPFGRNITAACSVECRVLLVVPSVVGSPRLKSFFEC